MSDFSEKVTALFERALQVEPVRRAVFLEGACGGDLELRRRVEEMLAGHRADSEFEVPSGATELSPAFLDRVPLVESAGAVIGRYRLLEKIGEGGFGSVWAAEQKEPVKRRVALKIIKLGMDTKQVVARFEAERQALALMDHPNIARVLDAGATETGRPFFVMELVKGIPITRYCDQERLETESRLNLFIQVCHAIQHAHQKGIIHRDIKPSNILVTLHDGVPVPKVIDFGIAKATQQELTEKTVYTQFNQFIGTPAYMSPEQAEMSGLDIDTRSDIYSLGVLLYELLTGTTPFDTRELIQSGLDEMRKIIREREPLRPSTRLSQSRALLEQPASAKSPFSSLHSDLDWIVMKCLEKDRTRRYDTANGLATDLKRHLSNEPVSARPPSAAYRMQKAWRRNKVLFSTGAAIGAALILGVVVSSWQAGRAIKAERLARSETIRAQKAEQEARTLAIAEAQAREQANQSAKAARLNLYAADLKLAQLALSENDLGRAVALLDRQRPGPGEPDYRGFEWRYLWRQAQGEESASTSLTNEGLASLSFSPEGRWVAAGGKNGVSLIDVASWREQKMLSAFSNAVVSVHFSPDGDYLLAAGLEEAAIWDTLTWKLKRKLDGASAPAGFAPDGRTLFCNGRTGLQIRDASTLGLLHQLPGQSIRFQWRIIGRNLVFSRSGEYLAALIEDASAPALNRFSIRIWKVADLRILGGDAPAQVISFPQVGSVLSLALSKDGRRVAASTTFRTIGVWDTANGELLAMHREPAGKTCQLLYRPESKTEILFGVRSDQTLRAWRQSGTNLIESTILKGHLAEIWALAELPQEPGLASGDRSGVVKLWKFSHHEGDATKASVDAIPDHFNHLQFLSDNKTLTALGMQRAPVGSYLEEAGQMNFWDTDSGRLRRAFSNVVWHAAVQVSPDAQRIAIARTNGLVEIYDMTNQGLVSRLQDSTNEVRKIRFTPDNRWMLTASTPQATAKGEWYPGDPWLRRWEVSTGRLLQKTNLVSGTVSRFTTEAGPSTLAMAPDGKTFGVQFLDGTLEIRQTSDFDLVFRGESEGIGGPTAAYSPDGRLLALTDLKTSEILLWDVAAQRLRFKLRGHLEIVHSVAFTPDGRTLASAGHDKTIRLWSPESGQELLSLPLDEGVFEIAFSSDGRILAAGNYDMKDAQQVFHVQLLRVPSFEDIRIAEVGR